MEISIKQGPLGTVVMELFKDRVPRTANNFLELVKNKYLGCKLHRIIPGFVIQGGDFERGDGSGGYSIYGRHFEDESFDIKHDTPGLLSMANSGPDKNGSQFFITLDYLPHLDNKHVVFGKVIKGMDIVKKIEQFGTIEGKPKELIKITNCGEIKN